MTNLHLKLLSIEAGASMADSAPHPKLELARPRARRTMPVHQGFETGVSHRQASLRCGPLWPLDSRHGERLLGLGELDA